MTEYPNFCVMVRYSYNYTLTLEERKTQVMIEGDNSK